MDKIYFQGGETCIDLKTLISLGFTQDGTRFRKTFKDALFTTDECHPARRSFEDLLVIARTYFPTTSEEELAKVLITTDKLVALYCRDIQKIVFCLLYYSKQFIIFTNNENKIKKGNGEYSALDFLKIADLGENVISRE